MGTKTKCDVTTPESRALVDEIVHGTFMKEGTMVAFPMCFPGVTVPIVPDESHITALDATPEGIVYGGTSGKAVHLFVAMFHGVTGVVFDMGTVEGATRCAAMCCGEKKFVACVNGPAGGRVITRAFQGLPFDLIQEWGFSRQPFQDLGVVVEGESILHAVATKAKDQVVGMTEGHLFVVDVEAGKVEVVEEIEGRGRLAVGSQGGVWGLGARRGLWRYDPATRVFQNPSTDLPSKNWGVHLIRWARDPHDGKLYVADDEGCLFAFDEDKGFSPGLGQVPLTPVGPMAVTLDGRLFGFCGDDLSKMFSFEPKTGEFKNLGVALSVIERRRYGYSFGDAVTGRDGEIVFGEDDDRGHLWLYFPRIVSR